MTEDRLDLALMRGDLRGLTKTEVADLVKRLTERMGVDAALAPIDIIPTREGRLVPYINARGAAELRKRHGLEITGIDVVKERPGLVVLRCILRSPDGRTDMAIGAAEWREDRPADEARAWMVAETRAKRRATMSAVGIFLEAASDEIEDEATLQVRRDADTVMVAGGTTPAGRVGAGASSGLKPAAPAPNQITSVGAAPITRGTRRPGPGEAAADDPAPGPAAADPVCGEPSPYADGEACVLVEGHAGYHRGKNKASWGDVLSTPEYNQEKE